MKYSWLVFLGLLVFQSVNLKAQVLDPSESPLDGVYSKSLNNPNRKPIPYVHLREADIMWLKRVWRVVDLREKINHVFYFPEKPTQGRKNFMTIVMEAITEEGTITAYSAFEADSITPTDMFKIPLTAEEAASGLKKSTAVTTIDEITEEEKDTIIVEDIPLREIKRFIIKEEVFFDKQRSSIETRILGIAPQKENYINGEFAGYQEIFWIYFPEARAVFAQNEVYNRHNDVKRLTYDDVFWKRMFSSRIIKESNVYDRYIENFNSPMDALLEAERIKEKIRYQEHDLWSY